jgi:probable F420-dependent oxidoreductase
MGSTVWYEAITLLATLASVVPRLRLGTAVLVAPFRHPVLAAKMLTTLDIASGGRVVVGVGVGYLAREYEELSVPFHRRGRYAEECIRIWKEVWSPGPASFSGEFFTIDSAEAEPKPVQQPHPPIWIGGGAPAVLRRTIDHADGWHPISLPYEGFAAGVADLRRLAEERGRELPLTLSFDAPFGWVDREPNDAPDRTMLSGSADQVLADIDRLRALGVSNVVFRPGLKNVSSDEILSQVEFVAEQVLSRLDRE